MPTPQPRPADKIYTAFDGHTYENSPRYSQYTGEWWFSSAFAAHSNLCECIGNPSFFQ